MIQNNRIIVVEDSEADRLLFTKYLHQLGYEALCFKHGKELIDAIVNLPSSVILMDVELPFLTGLETSKHIREFCEGNGRRFVIIGITGHEAVEIADEIAVSGFDDCLHKPVSRKDLETKLHQYIQKSAFCQAENHLENTNSSGQLYSLERLETDDQEFIRSIVRMFCDSTPEFISNIKVAYEQRDWETIRQVAHKLKPHYLFFSIDGVSEILHTIEELARAGKDDIRLPEMLECVERTSRIVIKQMEQNIMSGSES
ncbi:MAG TPA: response regulator [Bacteroidales bacterium]|nr:response regulator [Bacteroidales bacterium]